MAADLLKKADELELKESEKNKTNPEQISALGELLHDVYVTGCPEEIDYTNRRNLVRILNVMAKEIFGRYGKIVVEEYGSFVMDIFNSKSDLDLSVNFASYSTDLPKVEKINRLRGLAKRFYEMQRKGHISNFQPIYRAKIPILKLVDRGTGVECDISIENKDGIAKSHIVRLISSIDNRFQMLSFLMKAWAKAHNINSSVENTLNSLSIISLVAFHLQTRHPPILPPFSEIMKGGADLVSVKKEVANFVNYGKENKESLAELFVSLLNKLASVETLWEKGLCASTYEGSWILKDFGPKLGCVKVEDFTDRAQNISRAVRSQDLGKIYKRINLSIESLSAFMEGKIESPKLKELLFGATLAPAAPVADKSNIESKSVSEVPVLSLERGVAEMSMSIPVDRKSKKNMLPAGPPAEPKPKKKKKRAAAPPVETEPKKKNQPDAPHVDPKKPKKNKPPVVPQGSGRNPPVNNGRTATAGAGAPRVWGHDHPTENWGRMPTGAGTAPIRPDWHREPAMGLGITPNDALAALIVLGGIQAVSGGQPSNIWRRTGAESFVGAPGVGHYGAPTAAPRGVAPSGNWGHYGAPTREGLYGTHGVSHQQRLFSDGRPPSENWARAPTEGLYGAAHGGPSAAWGIRAPREGLYVGQYGGPAATPQGVPPSENWGRPPTVGQYGGPATAPRGVPPYENWARPPRDGFGGTPGVGQQYIQDSFVPHNIWRRQQDAFPRR